MYIILGLLLLMHASAHLVGFAKPFGLWGVPMPSLPTILDGRRPVAPITAKILGAAWLLGSLAFLVAALAVWVRVPWWIPYTGAAAVFSLVLSFVSTPDSRLGVPLNLGLLLLLLAAQHAGGLGELH